MISALDNQSSGFLSRNESELGNLYITKGFLVQNVEDKDSLDKMSDFIAKLAADHLGQPAPNDSSLFLNQVGRYVTPERLNTLRLAVINGINAEPWFRQCYFAIGRNLLATIVGNELAMQRRLNLSIQLPNDDSSLLPVHADVWSGDSPYEVVMWLPLVDCYETKAMYLTSPEKDREIQSDFSVFQGKSSEELFKAIESSVTFIKINYGQVLLFNHNMMHGNRVNREFDTRWSMNCRFKSVFSPYADKKLGEFFEPITLRPATRIGMEYSLPSGFEE